MHVCIITSYIYMCVQQHIKRDAQGYRDEFELQWRHYEAKKKLFNMAPGQQQQQQEFQSLVMFMAHVQEHYPSTTGDSFTRGIIDLLVHHGPLLEHSTRLVLVKALVLMRNKHVLSAEELLPVLFALFPIHDKAMRQLISRHIAADIKGANKKGRNEQFNRKIQNILLPILEQEDEVCAKRALSLFTDMWRRQIWRDAKTANAIASSTFHPSSRVMLGALKFFLGQDSHSGEESDSDDDDDDDDNGTTIAAQPTKEQMYKAFHKGTLSSKKKKQKKLKRAMHAVKKHQKREQAQKSETFAAIQLLHDPQGFAEKLFSKMKSSSVKADTRMLMMSVISRVIGVHQLILMNFYPFVQKYISPSRQDITSVLAALIQACHEQVPPDVLAPVLRQLVDQFIHDRARPEVITVGIKTVREICLRTPLVMTPELLQELVEYKKYRDKEVATVARGLLGLFRELAPSMLKKKDRGRMAGSDGIRQYGANTSLQDRVDGAELLEEAYLRSGVEGHIIDSDEDSIDADDDDDRLEDVEHSEGEVDESDTEAETSGDDHQEEENEERIDTQKKQRKEPEQESLSSLKKKLLLEQTRILTQEDFENIKALKHRKLVNEALQRHGLKSASKRSAAEQEADEQLALESKRKKIHEHAVNPLDLLGKKRGKADKQERLASVLEGREGREYGAKARIKNKKTGGLSNKEKQRRKNIPLGAVGGQVRKRLERNKLRSAKNFKGHVRK